MAHPVISTRNRDQWHHIASFLAGFPVRRMLGGQAARPAEGAPQRGEVAGCAALPLAINFGGCVAPDTACCPDGNHGEITEAYQA